MSLTYAKAYVESVPAQYMSYEYNKTTCDFWLGVSHYSLQLK